MVSLEEFGILPIITNSPALSAERSRYNHADYTDQALQVLQSLGDVVLSDVADSLQSYDAKWHPSGFMVFQLGTHLNLGLLRLHVWPSEYRYIGDKGDTIHDHSWHVASLVLRGTYLDTIFDVQPVTVNSEAERHAHGYLRKFSASYSSGGSQLVVFTEDYVDALPVADRVIPQSITHTIEPGVFHQPMIPIEQSVATLVLNSFRVTEAGPYVLINGPGQPITEIRPAVNLDEIAKVKEILS